MKIKWVKKIISLSALLIFASNAFAVWNEGQIRKVVVYEQTAPGTAVLSNNAYHFIANIRKSWEAQQLTGAVYLPNGAAWPENPLPVVTPSTLYGAHYQYEKAFATWNELNAAFPNGTYTFAVQRIYANSTTTLNPAVPSTVGAAPPSAAPVVQGGNWSGGTLLLNPADAKIYYAKANGMSFSWEVTGTSDAGGGMGGSSGMLDLTGIIGFGKTAHIELRHLTISGSQTTTDPNYSNPNEEQTFYASEEAVVRLDISTPSAAANFKILTATYTTDGKSWDVKPFFDSMMDKYNYQNWNWTHNYSGDDNAIIWDVEERKLTDDEYWGWGDGRIGTLHIAYQNDDGLFEGDLIYDWDFSANRWYSLVLPNPQLAPKSGALTVSPADWYGVDADAGTLSFTVRGSGTGTLPWSAWSAAIVSGSDWVRIAGNANGVFDSGSVAAAVSVVYAANPAGSDARTAQIQFTAVGAANSPLTVNIVQDAGPVVTPDTKALTVTPSGTSDVNAAAGTLSFTVSGSGNGDLPWSAAIVSGSGWARIVSSASGTLSSGGSATVSVAYDANPAGGAARAAQIQFTASGATNSPLTVNMAQAAGGTVTPPTPPDTWDLAGLSTKGVKLTAPKTLAVPKGVKLAKGTKAVYTWKRDGVVVAMGKSLTVKVSGVYTLTLTYTSADGQQHSQTQTFGTVKLFAQPKTVSFSVAQMTDTITAAALRSTSVVSGETLKLTVSVSTTGGGASGPFRYVWSSGGKVVKRQESTSVTDTFITPAYGDKAVGYKCVVELVARDAKSKPLATAKSKDFKAKIILPPSNVTLTSSASTVLEGKPLTLSATAKGTAALKFTWYKNGQQIASGSAKKFTKKPVTVSDAGTYYVIVSQDKTNRNVQSKTLTVNIQRADGTTVSGAQSQSAPMTASPAASPVVDPRQDAAATLSNSAAANTSASVLNLAPLKLSAGDVLSVSGTAPREYIILSETQHSTGAYRYEWRDNLTADFHDADADTQLTLRFTTPDGGTYELTVSGSVFETSTFELKKHR